jgi:oligopeptide/dipeptide ABC transporter ATP-binding protein
MRAASSRPATSADTLERPIHPLHAGLIGSVPSRNKRGVPLAQIPGMTPSLARLPPGCPFAPRCPRATAICRGDMPERRPDGARAARCHHPLVDPPGRGVTHPGRMTRPRAAPHRSARPILALDGVSRSAS